MKITIDGVEIDAQQLIDKGWTPPAPKPEVTGQHVSCMVEVSNNAKTWRSRKLVSQPIEGVTGCYRTGDSKWNYARLIRDPLPVAMIPWHGGDCPVTHNQITLLQVYQGSIILTNKPQGWQWGDDSPWSKITAYLPVDPRVPEET